MIALLWAYNGWFAISLVAGEVQNPQRNLPLSLMMGVNLSIGLYLLANLELHAPAHDSADRRHGTVASDTASSRWAMPGQRWFR
jgi:APA family basic amino acid/polyamine antiporter